MRTRENPFRSGVSQLSMLQSMQWQKLLSVLAIVMSACGITLSVLLYEDKQIESAMQRCPQFRSYHGSSLPTQADRETMVVVPPNTGRRVARWRPQRWGLALTRTWEQKDTVAPGGVWRRRRKKITNMNYNSKRWQWLFCLPTEHDSGMPLSVENIQAELCGFFWWTKDDHLQLMSSR